MQGLRALFFLRIVTAVRGPNFIVGTWWDSAWLGLGTRVACGKSKFKQGGLQQFVIGEAVHLTLLQFGVIRWPWQGLTYTWDNVEDNPQL